MSSFMASRLFKDCILRTVWSVYTGVKCVPWMWVNICHNYYFCSFLSAALQENLQTKLFLWDKFNLLCWGFTTGQPLWVILCCLPEKGRKEIEETQSGRWKRGIRKKEGNERKCRNRRNKNIPPLQQALSNCKPISVGCPSDKSYKTPLPQTPPPPPHHHHHHPVINLNHCRMSTSVWYFEETNDCKT